MKGKQIVLVVVVILIVVVAIFVKIPLSFVSTARIYPVKEWKLTSTTNGDIVSVFYDHKNGNVKNHKKFVLERGDVANLKFYPNYNMGAELKPGDTIAYLSSILMDEKMNILKNELEEENAYLSTLTSGAKQSLITSANQKFIFAKQEYELQEKNYQRIKKLFDEGIVPAAEFEEAENSYKLARTNIDVAKNNLEVLKSGEKPELINFTLAKINSLKNRMAFIQKKINNFKLTSPITGKIISDSDPLNILRVVDTSEYIVFTPVSFGNTKYINNTCTFSFKIPGASQEVEGKYLSMNQNVELIQNQQMLVAKAKLNASKTLKVFPGMFAQCNIFAGNVNLLDYIKIKIFSLN